MPTFTREQLRARKTHSANFTSAISFSMENNASSTAYFNIEGAELGNGKIKKVFDTASLSNIVSCSVVSGSLQAGFIILPNTTGSFVFTPSSTIAKEEVELSSSNVKRLASGSTPVSFFGVNLTIG